MSLMKRFDSWWWNYFKEPWRTYITWLAHGFMGLICGFVGSWYGACFITGFYGGKEYKESKHLTVITQDNRMDFLCPLLGGLIGALLRSLL